MLHPYPKSVRGATKGQNIDERLFSPLITWLNKYMPGGKFKEVVLNKEKRGLSQTPLRTTSVISDSEFYPTKKASISYISDSKIS
ncbi:sodium-coupled monocarboxylate transporter 1 [Trichonephila clavipes]|nr:sodium-coupled monocarboxylate transporter 1 [Trichonephila clavipes]